MDEVTLDRHGGVVLLHTHVLYIVWVYIPVPAQLYSANMTNQLYSGNMKRGKTQNTRRGKKHKANTTHQAAAMGWT